MDNSGTHVIFGTKDTERIHAKQTSKHRKLKC